MAHVEFIDQTLRDGQQSLWGMRMRGYEAAPALPYLDRTGFKVIDLTGATNFIVLVRDIRENPWKTLDTLVAGLPNNQVRGGNRTISVGGMSFAPDSVFDLWIATLTKHGVGSHWLFDCLYDMPNMKRAVEATHAAGAQPLPAIMYGLTPIHDDKFFADRAREMATWKGVTSIYIEDAPGVLTPERAATLLPAIRAAVPGVELELHLHNTTGLAPLVYLEGLKHGINVIHTASLPMANGPSLPSTEAMIENIEISGHTHNLDVSQLQPVADHFRRAARLGGHAVGVPNEFRLSLYEHQLPGGMTGTLKAQLSKYGMDDRFDDVLREIPRVRRDLGEPIMATPFSQFVGVQAVLNVVTGERYSLVPDEVIQYVLGHYGKVLGPIDQNVMDRVLDSPRAANFANWERPQPSLSEIRGRYTRGISDEELLLRVLTSDVEVDSLIEHGPRPDGVPTTASAMVENIVELIRHGRSRSLNVSRPGFAVQLSRSGQSVDRP